MIQNYSWRQEARQPGWGSIPTRKAGKDLAQRLVGAVHWGVTLATQLVAKKSSPEINILFVLPGKLLRISIKDKTNI